MDPVPTEATIPPHPPASEESTQVLVVGAGPTGLLLATELERRGVACLLIDENEAPRGWDRATVVHPRSMEIFEALGLIDHFVDAGVKTRGARVRSDGRTLGQLDFALADRRYDFDIGISEEATESVLTACLEAHGGAVTRATRLVGLQAEPDQVTATLEHEGEQRDIVASWVVGCGGLHSPVRHLAGIEFPGMDAAEPWAVFDATLDGWEDEFDLVNVHLETPLVIMTPLPGRRWRVYSRPTSDTSDLVADATSVVRRYAPGVTFADVENPTRFRCHSRVADRFRSGRLLLAGDAAHVCSPTEGHGMNTGLQDAFNLGWKLALVCQGAGGPSLLDSYEAERRPVAIRVVTSGSDVDAAQGLTDRGARAARDAEIRRTFADPASAHHEAVAGAELDRSYADSGIVTGTVSDRLAPGERLPCTLPVRPASGDQRPLHEFTHRPGHTLLVIGGREADPGQVGDLVAAISDAHGDSPLVSAVLGLCARPGDPAIDFIDASVTDELGIDGITVLAVRPDRYVGFRDDAAEPEALGRYLAALTA